MAKTVKSFVSQAQYASKEPHEAYTTDDGNTWRWVSNNSYIGLETCLEMAIPCNERMQKEKREKQVSKEIAAYRKLMKNHVHSHEEMSEMRAAFGEGATVVNVITGKKTKL